VLHGRGRRYFRYTRASRSGGLLAYRSAKDLPPRERVVGLDPERVSERLGALSKRLFWRDDPLVVAPHEIRLHVEILMIGLVEPPEDRSAES
jgi:hypothetical protein